MGAADLFSLNDIATEVGENYGDTSAQSLPKIKKLINRGLLEISLWPWIFNQSEDLSFTTVKDKEKYILDPIIQSINQLTIRDPDRKLIFMDNRSFRRSIPNPTTSTGDPTHYRLVGFTAGSRALEIALHPIPNGGDKVLIDANNQIPLFVNNTDDLRDRMPEHMLPLLILVATKLGEKQNDASSYLQTVAEVREAIQLHWGMINNFADAELHSIVQGDHQRMIRDGDPVLPPQFSRF